MVLWKTTVVLIASGLTGSGIVAFTSSGEPPEPMASATEADAPSSVPPDKSLQQQRYVQARFAAQRPFGCLFATNR
jgi:hypothetical protein